jgi:arabinoxylan arabinofuranohydrolase
LQYGADPSAHVFNGRVYVYASHDRNDAKEFDMTDHHVYSSDDMQNWEDHGPVLDVKDVPWGLSHLWAPDAAFHDGTYYLCICPRPRPPFTARPIGFATSKSPTGPFVAMPKPLAGVEGIDPSIFIDDDGQPYIVWAGKGLQMAKLKPDFGGVDGAVVSVKGIAHFFEGPWLFKRNGTYYMTYAGLMKGGSGQGGQGQWFSYATADHPMGPYTFRGDFSRTKPGEGNIHGSQVEYQGRWYCFYHDFSTSVGRAKHGFKRALRVDEMTFGADGSINDLKWTDAGPKQLKWIDAYQRHDAACLAQCDVPEGPHAIDTVRCPDGMALGKIDDGDWARYAGVDFGAGAARFTASVAGRAGGAIELHLDALDGPLIGTCPVTPSGDTGWRSVSAAVHGATGIHDLYLRFTGGSGGDLFEVEWFQFARS